MIETVSANGCLFSCFTAGPRDGPLALCLHGFPDTPHSWRHLAAELSRDGRRVVMPFLRGFAPTRAPFPGPAGAAVLGDDANALHAALGADDRAVLIGHDWGAAAAYHAVDRQPDRWSSLVACSWPPVPADLDVASFDQMRRSWYVFLFQSPLAAGLVAGGEFLAALWRSWSPGYDPCGELDHVAAAFAGPDGPEPALAHYRTLFAPGAPDLPLPRGRVTYVHGADDGCIGADMIEGLAPCLPPDGAVVVMPGVGHFPQLEAPAGFAAIVRRHLAGG